MISICLNGLIKIKNFQENQEIMLLNQFQISGMTIKNLLLDQTDQQNLEIMNGKIKNFLVRICLIGINLKIKVQNQKIQNNLITG